MTTVLSPEITRQTGNMTEAQLRLGSVLDAHHATPQAVGNAAIMYINELQLAKPREIFKAADSASIVLALHSCIAAVADRRHPSRSQQLPGFYDVYDEFMGHLSDEYADGLRSQDIPAIPRAVTLTLLNSFINLRDYQNDSSR